MKALEAWWKAKMPQATWKPVAVQLAGWAQVAGAPASVSKFDARALFTGISRCRSGAVLQVA